ncbi:CBS domain-containing protein [Nanoarchaeota archaeon]
MAYELNEIKQIRKNLGISQIELAKTAEVSQSLIAKIESNRIDPTFSKANKIFNALDKLSGKSGKKVEEVTKRKIVYVNPTDSIKSSIEKMKKHGISQLPVIVNHKSVGLVSEAILLDAMVKHKDPDLQVKNIMGDPPPIVPKNAGVEVVTDLLRYYPIILVAEKGNIVGIITKSDILSKFFR